MCVCVPVVRVVGLRSAPPDIGVVCVLLGAVGVALRLGGAAHELHSPEAVDAARQQHPVVMEVHGAVAAGLQRERERERVRDRDQDSFILTVAVAQVCVCTHLLGYGVPVQVALALVHALLVQELALVRDEQGVTHKLSHCNKKKSFFYTYTTGSFSPSLLTD